MSTDAVRMSQWPSDQRYVIPVAPGPDVVTVTIDGKEVQAPRGEHPIEGDLVTGDETLDQDRASIRVMHFEKLR